MLARLIAIAAALLLACGTVRAETVVVTATREFLVLSPEDVALYKDIFALQAQGRMSDADAKIAQLSDKILMGYVLQQRYLHPSAWNAKPAELKEWMEAYADQAGAEKVYPLARRRAGAKAAIPAPILRVKRDPGEERGEEISFSGRAAPVKAKVNALIRDARPTQALTYISGAKVRRLLSQTELDALRQLIAWSYFLEGKDKEAIKLAMAAGEASRDDLPLIDWVIALSSYRLRDYARAGHHFELFARNATTSWSRAAGAFWAARCFMISGQPQKVLSFLGQAATAPETFYGLLALRMLGRDPPFAWHPLSANSQAIAALRRSDPAVNRAIALSQVDRRDFAEEELLRVFGRIAPQHEPALAALAERLGMPATQMAVAMASGSSRETIAGRYPIMTPEPEGGFMLDAALVLAFIRAESAFDPSAVSGSGARGLLQIMPGTAKHINGETDPDRLLDGGYNLKLGQLYLQEMLGWGEPSGNIFMLATAFNAGPGNLQKWNGSVDFQGDPLLYIESVPARQTRIYIERIMANYWIYQYRLKEERATLDAVAAGDWPTYRRPAPARTP
ncbi:MAG: lytic transglycosylase domain-containing protein [Alphaproteobacteria bacterium]|nr:lytic transglycosylase domain-containing protein [Alphaproteobacteria bacterium]